MPRTLTVDFVLAVALTLLWPSGSGAADAPVSRELQQRLAAAPADFPERVWVYLDASAADPNGVNLSERSLRRRAKADPAGMLIDELDYPIRTAVVDSIAATGATVRQVSKWLRAVSVDADAVTVSRLAHLPFVRGLDLVTEWIATPEPEVDASDYRASQTPLRTLDLPYGRSLAQVQFINAVTLHQQGLSGKGVAIAILDTGYKLDHQAFDSLRILATRDFINNTDTVDQPDCPLGSSSYFQTRHGTLILGVLASYWPDTLIGIAYGADLLLAKTEITCDGVEIRLEEDNWLAAAEWADSAGADIITTSLGYSTFQDDGSLTFADLDGNTTLITRTADWAASKNILVLSSAGNEREGSWGHITAPADGDSVLAVGATFGDSTVASFSSPGPTADGRIKPDVSTLGTLLYTTGQAGDLTLASGTSLATPLVAGGAALALENDTAITAHDLLDLIRRTATQAESPDNDLGYGLYDAARSANIVRLDMPSEVLVPVESTVTVEITTRGTTAETAEIYALNLPSGSTLLDRGNGTASLTLYGNPELAIKTDFAVIADVGYLADTAVMALVLTGLNADPIYAGPNPFADSVRFFVSSPGDRLESASVFNLAGEIVWEKVNNDAVSADVLTWYGTNRDGHRVASGLYVALVKSREASARIKLLKID